MPQTMHPFLEHLEAHLGLIQAGARLGEGLQAARFADRPSQGASTFVTLGLSHHRLKQGHGPDVRIEFILACREEFVDSMKPPSVLADVCDDVLAAHAAPPFGAVFGPRGKFFNETEMEALYCTPPVYFDEALGEFGGFGDPFLPIWLVPITAAEAAFVRQRGNDAFLDTLETANPDLLDLRRPAVVKGGDPVHHGRGRPRLDDRVEVVGGRSKTDELFRCRVCGLESGDSRFCTECLADTMVPASSR